VTVRRDRPVPPTGTVRQQAITVQVTDRRAGTCPSRRPVVPARRPGFGTALFDSPGAAPPSVRRHVAQDVPCGRRRETALASLPGPSQPAPPAGPWSSSSRPPIRARPSREPSPCTRSLSGPSLRGGGPGGPGRRIESPSARAAVRCPLFHPACTCPFTASSRSGDTPKPSESTLRFRPCAEHPSAAVQGPPVDFAKGGAELLRRYAKLLRHRLHRPAVVLILRGPRRLGPAGRWQAAVQSGFAAVPKSSAAECENPAHPSVSASTVPPAARQLPAAPSQAVMRRLYVTNMNPG